MDEENTMDLKAEINNLIWMYAPAETRLEEAESIACDVLTMIKEGTTSEGLEMERTPWRGQTPRVDA